MSITCDKCGGQVRTVCAYLRTALTVIEAFESKRILPRLALTDEQDAAIPWGDHPDDGQFGVMCDQCATELMGGDTCS